MLICFIQLVARLLTVQAASHQAFLKTTSPHRQLYQPRLPHNLDLLQTSIEELGLFLSNGSLTSVDLVKAYLFNIKRDNHQGLNLRAVIQTAPLDSVIDIASKLDQERSEGHVRGPLHGIPILVKDNIATDIAYGMDTSAGNFALKEAVVKGDAEAVIKLRKAGAIIIGKANMCELAHAKAYQRSALALGQGVTNGWSAVGGQTSSAYVEGGFAAGGDPSGSSSGSAVGVSAGFAACSLGSDTGGSVIGPAHRAALFGIRPTTGLVSGAGVVPITADMDTIGPIGFTTRDTAILLDALTYDDGRYLNATRKSSLKHLRLGLVRNNFLDEADGRVVYSKTYVAETCVEEIEISLRNAMKKLEIEAGVEVIDVNLDLTYVDLEKLVNATLALSCMGMKEDLGRYMEGLESSPVRSLRDLVEWNEAHALMMKDIEFKPDECCQQRLLDSLVAPSRQSSEYAQAWETVHELGMERGFGYAFERYQLDALVFSPELGTPEFLLPTMAFVEGTAPLGYCKNGAPHGILFVTKPHEEEKLFGILAGYEAMMPKRRTPGPLSKLVVQSLRVYTKWLLPSGATNGSIPNMP